MAKSKNILLIQSASSILQDSIELLKENFPEAVIHLLVTSTASRQGKNICAEVEKIIRINATQFGVEFLNQKEKEQLTNEGYDLAVFLCQSKYSSKYSNVMSLAKLLGREVGIIEDGKYYKGGTFFRIRIFVRKTKFFIKYRILAGIVFSGLLILFFLSWMINSLRYKLSRFLKLGTYR